MIEPDDPEKYAAQLAEFLATLPVPFIGLTGVLRWLQQNIENPQYRSWIGWRLWRSPGKNWAGVQFERKFMGHENIVFAADRRHEIDYHPRWKNRKPDWDRINAETVAYLNSRPLKREDT